MYSPIEAADVNVAIARLNTSVYKYIEISNKKKASKAYKKNEKKSSGEYVKMLTDIALEVDSRSPIRIVKGFDATRQSNKKSEAWDYLIIVYLEETKSNFFVFIDNKSVDEVASSKKKGDNIIAYDIVNPMLDNSREVNYFQIKEETNLPGHGNQYRAMKTVLDDSEIKNNYLYLYATTDRSECCISDDAHVGVMNREHMKKFLGPVYTLYKNARITKNKSSNQRFRRQK